MTSASIQTPSASESTDAAPLDPPSRSPATSKANLAGMSLAHLREFFATLGEKPFRAAQVLKWIHQRGVIDFQAMTDISKPLRDKLMEVAEIRLPEVVE